MTDYLIKSMLVQASMLCIYWGILRNLTYFNFNRVFLVGSIIGSLTVPVINFPRESTPVDLAYVISELSKNSLSGALTFEETSTYISTIFSLVVGIYMLCTIFMIYRLLSNLIRLYRVTNQTAVDYFGCFPIISSNGKFPIHSFFRYIIVSKSDFQKGIDTDLLTHESIHLRQYHSLDIIFIEVIQAFMWFNPLLVWFKKAIRLNHEFLADKYTNGGLEYARKIINYSAGDSCFPLTSTFNYSFIKTRIKMLKTQNSRTRRLIGSFGIIASLLLGFIILSSFSKTGKLIRSEYNFSGAIKIPDHIEHNGYQVDIKRARIYLDINPETGEVTKWKISFANINCASSGELVFTGNDVSFLYSELLTIADSKLSSGNLVGQFLNENQIEGSLNLNIDYHDKVINLGTWNWKARN